MSDQNQDEALNSDEQNIQTESPAVEEKVVEDVNTVETQPESTEQGETEAVEAETIGESKKGAAQRIRELSKEKNEYKETVKSLQDRIAELTGSVEPSGLEPQYTPQITPGSEITEDQYKQDVIRSADALVTLKIKQSEAVNRINNETAEVMKNYPQLDPGNEAFNRELSETITEAVEAYVKASPYTASVKKFADKLMKPYLGAVEQEVGKAKQNIIKQVSEAALRPTSIRKEEKSANEKSIAELEQELGIVQA